MQPALEHTATHRCHGAVEYCSQRVFHPARQVLGDFQIAACGGVHDDAVLLTLHGDGTNMRQRGALGIFYVLQQTAGSA